MTVVGSHDTPPIVDRFDLPPVSSPLYVWTRRGAYALLNSSANSYFVPNRTTVEFDAFLSHMPTGVSASQACWSATLSGVCAGGTLAAGTTGTASCGTFACEAGQWVRDAPAVQVFTSDGWFTARETGIHKVLAVGAGVRGVFGAGYDSGRGGGSGYVTFTTVPLSAGDSIYVTIGQPSTVLGGTSSFGSFLAAGGGYHNTEEVEHADGGSGGGAGRGGVGGYCGENGRGPAGCIGCAGLGEGRGQGPSFYQHFSDFSGVSLSCGAGGQGLTSDAGGGGGGGVVIDGVPVAHIPNGLNTNWGGTGYGAGGAGGNRSVNGTNNTPGEGFHGVVVVEW